MRRSREQAIELGAGHIYTMAHRLLGVEPLRTWDSLPDDTKSQWRETAAAVVDGEWNLEKSRKRYGRA